MVAAFFLGGFAIVSFGLWGNIWIASIPLVFTLALVAVGLSLIAKRRSPLSKQARVLIALAIGIPLMSASILDLHIRHDRKILQVRAKEFLSRPIPNVLNTNFIGYFQSSGSNVLVDSRSLIERYANNGRIRWSARIQGQFATVPFGIDACAEVARTNQEARFYLADCSALLDKEWRMGFWQFVQDSIEMKRTIPEHEEENFKPPASINAASLQP
jgi:hypothetical protein